MTFGDKVREERLKLGLTQKELAEKLGVTTRIISTYETDKSFPRYREKYVKLAEIFSVDINYLLTEDTDFIIESREKYGENGAKQAKDLMKEINGLFSGGELAEEDMDEFMRVMQEAYWIAKKKNRKYTPKKFTNTND